MALSKAFSQAQIGSPSSLSLVAALWLEALLGGVIEESGADAIGSQCCSFSIKA
jgi:hypothetical protein